MGIFVFVLSKFRIERKNLFRFVAILGITVGSVKNPSWLVSKNINAEI